MLHMLKQAFCPFFKTERISNQKPLVWLTSYISDKFIIEIIRTARYDVILIFF